MSNNTSAPFQVAPHYASPQLEPGSKQRNWLLIALLVIFGGPILLSCLLVACLVILGAVAAVGSSSNATFNEISAEVNRTSASSATVDPTATIQPSDAPVLATPMDQF